MASGSFDFAPLLAPSLPPPAAKWTGFPKYNFTGGNNDADHVPVDRLIAAVTAVLGQYLAQLCGETRSGPSGAASPGRDKRGITAGKAGSDCDERPMRTRR